MVTLFEIDLSGDDFELMFGAHKIEVKFVEDDTWDGGVHGDWSIDKMRIRIQSDMPYPLTLSTFIHEFMHAVEDLYSLEIQHKELNILGDCIASMLIQNFGAGDDD